MQKLFATCVVIATTLVAFTAAAQESERKWTFSSGRSYEVQGTGRGNAVWLNGSIPYKIQVLQEENIKTASRVLKQAADHIAEFSCIRFHEVDASFTGTHVLVQDTSTGSCNAGTTSMQYDGCGAQWGLVVHEMMHVLGIGHEHQRYDSARHLKVDLTQVKTDFQSQWTQGHEVVHGAYDWLSLMHYHPSAFALGTAPIFVGARQTFGVGCSTASPGDRETVRFIAQNCNVNPVIQCRSSNPEGLQIGSSETWNVTFTSLFKAEVPNVTWTNLPAGATTHTISSRYGSAYKVKLSPVAADYGKTFNITATFTNAAGAKAVCSSEVKISASPHVCNGVDSTDASVCSGHGTCNSAVFPQCACQAGWGGPWCEGRDVCPQDVNFDWELDVESQCIDSVADAPRIAGPTGWATNGSKGSFGLTSTVARKPSEISFLLNTKGNGTMHFWIGPLYFALYEGRIGGLLMLGWSFVQVFPNYESRTYTVYVNGTLVQGSRAMGSGCTAASCNFNSFTWSSSYSENWMAVDRFRMRCGAQHIAVTADPKLTAGTLLLQPVVISLLAPHADYAWDLAAVNAAPPCTSTNPSVLQGATYKAVGNVLNLTLPMGGSATTVRADSYITCIAKTSHFKSGAAITVSGEPHHLKMQGLCSDDAVYYKNAVATRDFGQELQLQPRPDVLEFDVGVNATSDFEMRLRSVSAAGSTIEVATINVQPALNRLRVSVGSSSVRIPLVHTQAVDTPLASVSNSTFAVAIDWSAMNLTIRRVNSSATIAFNGTSLSRASFWFWSNAPLAPLRIVSRCENTVPVTAPSFYTTYGTQGTVPAETPLTQSTGSPGVAALTPRPVSTSSVNSAPLAAVAVLVLLLLQL